MNVSDHFVSLTINHSPLLWHRGGGGHGSDRSGVLVVLNLNPLMPVTYMNKRMVM